MNNKIIYTLIFLFLLLLGIVYLGPYINFIQEGMEDNKKENSGSSSDNYNHYSQSSFPAIYGEYKSGNPSAGTFVSITDGIIKLIKPDNTAILYKFVDDKFIGDDKSTVSYFKANDGTSSLKLQTKDGQVISFTQNGAPTASNKPPATTESYTPSNNYNYSSLLPAGIPRSDIPSGQEDLYILKSEVIPPVCPACPSVRQCGSKYKDPQKCPPCPACARCPEPSFECKKVPNYNAVNNMTLPVPVIADFSTFGM
jgi:hypothetical protein